MNAITKRRKINKFDHNECLIFFQVESKLDRELHHATAIGSSKLVQKILDSGKVHVDCQDEVRQKFALFLTISNEQFLHL